MQSKSLTFEIIVDEDEGSLYIPIELELLLKKYEEHIVEVPKGWFDKKVDSDE